MNLHAEQRELRILAKQSKGLTKAQAEEAVTNEGSNAFAAMVTGFVKSQEPKERVYKIKRSLKGARVKVAGFEGRSFSFGPIWENFVKAGKGPALTDQKKVRAHAVHLGVPNALKAKFGDVLSALQAKLS
jgi:hypothetical protein